MDSVAKFVIEYLLSKGIDTFFAIPGGPIAPLFDGIYRTPGVTLIESKHETEALFEAIGYYKSTGKVPGVIVTAGPGITNSLTGIASAKALRVPVLVFCGDTAWEKYDHIMLQSGGPEGIDIDKTFAPHTDMIVRHRDPEHLVQEIANLLNNRSWQAPSISILPLHLTSVQIEKPEINDLVFGPEDEGPLNHNVLTMVSTLLHGARHPLVVVGYGAHFSSREVLEFIDNVQVPFVTTPQSKGIMSETHPLSLRNAGMGASQWARKYLQEPPDVTIVLGTDLDDCAVGTTQIIGPETKLIHVDINNRVFNRKFKTEFAFHSSIRVFVRDWMQLGYEPRIEFNLDEIKSQSAFDVPDFRTDKNLVIAPHRLLADIEASCPSGVRFVTDIGEHMLFALHYLTIKDGNQFSIDLGLGSMGSGIGQAIGMCLGDRKPTVCIVGDGCFQMYGMEILTAIKHKLPIAFVIFNDARYNMVSNGFKCMFNIDTSPGQTDFIDFVKVAEGMGAKGFRIEKPGEIDCMTMNAIFEYGSPVIIDARIDKEVHIKGAGRIEVLKHMGENDG